MTPEFSGIERRLDELCERLARLETLAEKPRTEFDRDPYLRDIAERNLEVAAQCCIDIAHRILSLSRAQRPREDLEALRRLGELDVLDAAFAQRFAPVAGFRNVLAHEYLTLDWDEVYRHLEDLSDFRQFVDSVRGWLQQRMPAGEETS